MFIIHSVRIFFCFIALLPLAVSAQQSVVINGKITDTHGVPLSQVAIAVSATSQGTYSDDKGFYRLEVPQGKHTLVTSFIGYEAQSKQITADKNKTVNFTLKETAVNINSVSVFGKSKVQQLRESVYSIDAIDIKEMANSVTNVRDIINHATGVKVRNEGGLGSDFELSLNGMSGNSVRYFVDGVPMNTMGDNVSLDNFPVNAIDRIEIYKGVVPAELGADALGGAINIITKKENKNFIDASVSAGSFHTYVADFRGQFQLPESGLIIKPTLGYSYSKNDYKVKDVEVWDEENDKYISTEKKRFHDDYRSLIAQMEFGIERKSWADLLTMSVSYTKTDKELQTGSVQNIVYGAAERQQHAWNVQMRYKKDDFLLKNLSANILTSHTWDNSLTIDTAYRQYTWDGTWTPTSRNEITGRARQMRRYKRPMTAVRANLNYNLDTHNSLNLNYMFTRTGNNRTDDLGEDEEFVPSNDVLAKHIFGLSYNQLLWNGKVSNVAFLKDYMNYVHVEQNDLYWITNSAYILETTTKNNLGGGVGTRISFCEPFAVKASYERTVRLPLARELLGNGSTVYPNLALEPEKSHNINAGIFGTVRFNDKHILYYEGGVFYRKVEDYIHFIISESEGTGQYDNVSNVTMKGVEGEVRYNWSDWLQASVNCSYQDARDKNRYKEDGKPSVTYNNKVPNKPWLFGNADLTLTKHAIFNKEDRVRFNYNYQYVHWFFLTWEGYGMLATKARIPTQNFHSAAITYSWQKERYNFTLECNNLFDCTAYDNYKLQKPGRSFLCKFRVFIH